MRRGDRARRHSGREMSRAFLSPDAPCNDDVLGHPGTLDHCKRRLVRVMGWKRDPEKFRRHVAEAKGFWGMATGDEPAGVEDIFGRPFLPPEGPPVTYEPGEVNTSPGDERSDVLFRLQQLAQSSRSRRPDSR